MLISLPCYECNQQFAPVPGIKARIQGMTALTNSRLSGATRETGAHVKDGIRATPTPVLAAAVLATIGLSVGDSLGGLRRHDQLRWVVVGSAVGFVLFGVIAVRGAARQVARLSEPRAGIGAASVPPAVLDLRLHPGPSRITPAAERQSGRTARRRCRDRRDPRHPRSADPWEASSPAWSCSFLGPTSPDNRSPRTAARWAARSPARPPTPACYTPRS